MRRVVLQMTMSIDGFVDSRHGHPGMLPEDEGLKRRKLEWLSTVGTHIMGRTSYEQMATAWPTSLDDYAAPMNEIPKVVFSKSLKVATWPETRIASGALDDEIANLKRGACGDIAAWGGATFAQALSAAGLIDEYRLVINPIAYGEGLPIFASLPAASTFALVEATIYPSGAALHVYQPKAGDQD